MMNLIAKISSSVMTRFEKQMRNHMANAIAPIVNKPYYKLNKLSLMEMFIECQKAGYDIDISFGEPLLNADVSFDVCVNRNGNVYIHRLPYPKFAN